MPTSDTNRVGTDSGAARPSILLLLLMLFGLAAGLFLPSLRFGFVFDDRLLVVENYFIQDWKYLPELFTHYIYSDIHSTVQRNYYRPVFSLLFLVNYSLFGLHPAGWHAVTVLLHGVAAVLFFRLARRLTQDMRVSLLAAVVFAAHPVHVEAVAWVSGVPEPLSTALLLAAFLCYLNAQESARRFQWLAGAIVGYLLAALTKEGAVLFPALVAWHRFTFSAEQERLPERFRRSVFSAIPFVPVLALYLAARYAVLGQLGAAASNLTFAEALLTLPEVLQRYARLLLLPVGLSPFYDVPVVTSPGWAQFWLPLLTMLALLGATLFLVRRSAAGRFGLGWMLLALLPVLQLRVFPAGELLHDRYLYLPSVGFSLLAGIGLRALIERRSAPVPPENFSRVDLAAAAGVAVLLAGLSLQAMPMWQDNLSLYSAGASRAPRNNLASHNLALELYERGAQEEAMQRLEAILARDPGYWLAAYNLALFHYRAGRLPEALELVQRAIRISPGEADQHALLGRILYRQGRPAEGIAAMQRAIQRRPRAPGYHVALGLMLRSQGRLEEAAQAFRGELEIQPNQAVARQQLAEVEAASRGRKP